MTEKTYVERLPKTIEISFVVYPGESSLDALGETIESFELTGRILEGRDDNGHLRAEVCGAEEEIDKFEKWYHAMGVELNPEDPIY